jgi:hypothetical protein
MIKKYFLSVQWREIQRVKKLLFVPILLVPILFVPILFMPIHSQTEKTVKVHLKCGASEI